MFELNTFLLIVGVCCLTAIAFILWYYLRPSKRAASSPLTSLLVDSDVGTTAKLLSMQEYLGLNTPKHVYETKINDLVIFKKFHDKLFATYPDKQIEVLYEGSVLVKDTEKSTETKNIMTKTIKRLLLKVTLGAEYVLVSMDVFDMPDPTGSVTEVAKLIIYFNKYTTFKRDTIIAIAADKDIKYAIPKVPRKIEELTIQRLMKSNNGYATNPHKISTKVDDNTVDALYKIRPFIVEGQKYVLNPSEIVPIIVEALADGENVAIIGLPGMGKTTFSRYILSKVKQNPNVREVFDIDEGSLSDIFSSNFEANAALIFGSTQGEPSKKVNVLALDEAHDVLNENSPVKSNVLTSLDGNRKEMYNTAFLCCFNESELDNLDEATFRGGRFGVIVELDPLNAKEARSLADLIEEDLPATKFVDRKKLETIINEDSKLPNSNTTYAKAQTAAMGDVFSTVRRKAYRNVIAKRLEQKKKSISEKPGEDLSQLVK